MNMRPVSFLATAAVLLAGACGGSSVDSPTPTSPVVAAGATANGNAGTGTTTLSAVIGTISAFTGACPSVTFTLERKTIKTNASTTYGDGKCADLKNGLRVGVTGTAQGDGSILATSIRAVRLAPPMPAFVTGTISGFSGTCPLVTFALERKTIKTNASTTYGAGKCSDLKNGVRIAITGTTQGDGSILAAQVLVAPPPPPMPTLVTGSISGLSGTCPALTFTLEGRTIKTTAATTYGTGKCTDLKNALRIAITGTVQGDRSIVATKVAVAPSVAAVMPAIAGAITTVTGTCPVLTITVGTKVATTTAATVFDGKGCRDLRAGVMVSIYGAVPAGGTAVAATKVVASR